MKKMTEEVYLEMKRYINEYEIGVTTNTDEQPYFEVVTINVESKYNPNYGDERECECGHSYYRHFDSYEQMENVGCKYCGCPHFHEKPKT